jgi:hypothetical protein
MDISQLINHPTISNLELKFNLEHLSKHPLLPTALLNILQDAFNNKRLRSLSITGPLDNTIDAYDNVLNMPYEWPTLPETLNSFEWKFPFVFRPKPMFNLEHLREFKCGMEYHTSLSEPMMFSNLEKVTITAPTSSYNLLYNAKRSIKDLDILTLGGLDFFEEFFNGNTVLETLRLPSLPYERYQSNMVASNVKHLVLYQQLNRDYMARTLNYVLQHMGSLEHLEMHFRESVQFETYLKLLTLSEARNLKEITLHLHIGEVPVQSIIDVLLFIKDQKPDVRVNGFSIDVAMLELTTGLPFQTLRTE